MNARQELGRSGEERAARWYLDNGYEILDRNWRSGRLGEIDIVARQGNVLVICEVKNRTSVKFGTPLEAITTSKQTRLRSLGLNYVAAKGIAHTKLRFDVVAILAGEMTVMPGVF